MPLAPPVPRQHVHTRTIELCGFVRDDGNIDVEAHLVDTRSFGHAGSKGCAREAGAPLHDMHLRMTITPRRDIVSCGASMAAAPFAICPATAPRFASLAGLRIESGFLRRAMERVGGTDGCTHLRELLQQMGTVFVQTLYSARKINPATQAPAAAPPALLNSCYAWSDTRAMVAMRFPAWSKSAESENA